MTNLNLNLGAKTRQETKKKVSQLREQNKIPAVLYGHQVKPINLVVDYHVFDKIFKQAGESTLIDLTIDGKEPVKVLVQDYQLDPETNQFLHVDFHQVRMDEELQTEIKLKFINEAPAVKELSGILVTNMHSLAVKCLPKDLVHEIEVDLSGLKTFEDAIHVADIKVPAGINILHVPDDVVALVQLPKVEKEEPKAEAETVGEEPKAEAEVKVEKEEPDSKN